MSRTESSHKPIVLTERGRRLRDAAIKTGKIGAMAAVGASAVLGVGAATAQHVEGSATIQPYSGEPISEAIQDGVNKSGVEVPADDISAAAGHVAHYAPGFVSDRAPLQVTVSSSLVDNMLGRKTVEVENLGVEAQAQQQNHQ